MISGLTTLGRAEVLRVLFWRKGIKRQFKFPIFNNFYQREAKFRSRARCWNNKVCLKERKEVARDWEKREMRIRSMGVEFQFWKIKF